MNLGEKIAVLTPLLRAQDRPGIASALSACAGLNIKLVNYSINLAEYSFTVDDGVFVFSSNEHAIHPVVHRIIECGEMLNAIICSRPNKLRFGFGDEGARGEICFCSSDAGACLIPDSEFMGLDGYKEARSVFVDQVDWHKRSRTPYWRGSTTGLYRKGNIFSLQRAKLCAVANRLRYDARLTAAIGISDQEENDLRLAGLMGSRRHWSDAGKKKYNIDVDGNTSAWSSLYIKLLSGGVVLKLDSINGYRQWYYDRLIPWENFVPIKADASDLKETVDRLEGDTHLAEAIGRNGRELALSMTKASEIAEAVKRVRAYTFDS